MRKLLLTVLCGLMVHSITSQVEYKDVAGIFYARCSNCHHTGTNSISFMNYTETAMMSSSIQNDLINNVMPPWSADTTYTRFQHERIITASEKQKILEGISIVQKAITGKSTMPILEGIYIQTNQSALTRCWYRLLIRGLRFDEYRLLVQKQ